MDSDSYFIINLFQQGSYRAALSAYEALPSPAAFLSVYAARCHLALTPPSTSSAMTILSSLEETLDTRAVSALAKYLEGSTQEAVLDLEDLLGELGEVGLEENDEGRLVRSIVGTVWILEGEDKREEGVEILREALEIGKDQESLAILSHLYLSLSLASYSAALLQSPSTMSFTSDSLLSQLLSARTNLALGPTSKYQEAYYVYEEIKGMQGGRGEATLAGIAVAQALLGRWDESTQAVSEALEMNPSHATSLANAVILALHTGKTQAVADQAFEALQSADPTHSMVLDLAEKASAFDQASSKFSIAAGGA